MTVVLTTTIRRYVGAAADTKPTGVPPGSEFYAGDTGVLYVTVDGTNWVVKTIGAASLDAAALAALESITADTELPAARLAADNLALPTAPDVLATLMVYDGATMDLLRSAQASGDGFNGAGALDAMNRLFNGANWDRQRNNSEGTLLASAARTATTSSADQVNYNSKGTRVFFNITAVPTVETVTLAIEVKDPISGVYTAILTSAALSATGHTVLTVYPGATVAANVAASIPLGRGWRITVTHSAAGSFTYSVGYSNIL